MEYQYVNSPLSLNSETTLIPIKCGEVIIIKNSPLIEFGLICLYCDKQSNTFEDFKNHFLIQHYEVEDEESNLDFLGLDESSSSIHLDQNMIPNDTSHVTNSNNKLNIQNCVEMYSNNSENEIQEDSENYNSFEELAYEIKIERYNGEIDKEETSPASNFVENENDNSESESDKEHFPSLKPKSFDIHGVNKLQQQFSNSHKLAKKEKTIEIYKEEYIPEKTKFILAAVNFPAKSNTPVAESNLSKSSGLDSETEFSQTETIDKHFEEIDEDCKPKFKFDNIKFRRNHNENYYLSIEKTYNIEDNLFYCPKCTKRYKRIETLRYHYLSHTGVPPPYECSICHKGFPSAYKVRIHFTKHTGERPFRCHLCPRVYRHKQQLKFHLQTHF